MVDEEKERRCFNCVWVQPYQDSTIWYCKLLVDTVYSGSVACKKHEFEGETFR